MHPFFAYPTLAETLNGVTYLAGTRGAEWLIERRPGPVLKFRNGGAEP